MGGRNTRHRTGLFLLSVLILCQLPLNTHADESPIVFVIDERVQMRVQVMTSQNLLQKAMSSPLQSDVISALFPLKKTVQ